jgi:hypothetical protein
MTQLTDDELERHLDRRLGHAPLDEPARGHLLQAISQQSRALPRSRHQFAWRAWRLGTAGVAAVVVGLLVALALPLLGLPDPAASPSAGSPSPSAAATSLRIYTASEVSALAADPANDGRIVIMSLEADGFVAVRMADRLVQIGSVTLREGAWAWTVGDVLAARDEQPAYLMPVAGWLLGAPNHFCDGSSLDDRFQCGAEVFITPTQQLIAQQLPGGGVHIALPSGGLRVQDGAYEAFASDPLRAADGLHEPRFGIYLVRWAGCVDVGQTPTPTPWLPTPTNVASVGACPYFEVVGRLEPPPAPSERTPSVSITPDPTTEPPSSPASMPLVVDGEPVLVGEDALAHVQSAADDTPFLIGGTISRYFIVDCVVSTVVSLSPFLTGCPFWPHMVWGNQTEPFVAGKPSLQLIVDHPVGILATRLHVLRVHVHDPRAADCPAGYATQCQQAVVVEAVVWQQP